MAFSAYNRYWPEEEDSAKPGSSISLEQLHQLARKREAEREVQRSKHHKQRKNGDNITGGSSKRHSEVCKPKSAGDYDSEVEPHNLLDGHTEEEVEYGSNQELDDITENKSSPRSALQTEKRKKKKKNKEPKLDSPELSNESEISDMEVAYAESPSQKDQTQNADAQVSSASDDQPRLQSDDQIVQGSSSEEDKHSESGGDSDDPDREPVSSLVPLTQERSKSGSGVERVHRRLPQWIVEADIIEDSILDHSRSLDDFNFPEVIVKNLSRMGVSKLFPVQVHVIPELLSSQCGPLLTGPGGTPSRDVCVCAPTGCGKTLCYVLPIVAALMNRVITQVRAVVVVPSQELALQVHMVFEQVSHGTRVQIGVVCGQASVEKESAMLQDSSMYPPCSGVDVVIATPGRLVEHINRESFVSLSFLRYLVVDEADKLLDQHYNQWLSKLLVAVATDKESDRGGGTIRGQRTLCDTLLNLCTDVNGLRLLRNSQINSMPTKQTLLPHPLLLKQPKSPLQKLLFSATMTYNPEHLATLSLRQPKLFTVSDILDSKYSHDTDTAFILPAQLEENIVKCSLKNKPLVLLHLVTSEEFSTDVSKVLCFTNSRESTRRLFLLMQAFGVVSVGEISGLLSQGQRKEILGDFKNGRIQILICSDQMARGMDVEGVSCVVNYEPPRQFRTYLHRAGRTARAGLRGVVYTLLAHDEVHSFNTMLRKVHHRRLLGEVSVTQDQLKQFLPLYQTALEQLRTQSN